VSRKANKIDPIPIAFVVARIAAAHTRRVVARPPRFVLVGGTYHVTARGNRRQPIFVDAADNACFFAILANVVRRFAWHCHSYCLLPNHYHLLIETPHANLSAGMQRLNGVYAQAFNQRHGFVGHVFQGRFHSVLVESASHLVEIARYLALNPVRSGLCGHPSDWAWSSYRATAGLAAKPPLLTVGSLLEQFGTTPERAREAFVRFVATPPPRA
jgi:putative transposase